MFFEILLPRQHNFLLQRYRPLLHTRVAIIQGNIPQRNPKYFCELLNALRPERVVTFACSLADSGTDILDIAINVYCLQLGVVILNEPVEPNIVAVIFSHDVISHFTHLEQVRIVEVHEMSTDEGQTDQPDIENIFCLAPTILKTFIERVFIIPRAIGYDWPDASDRIFLPHLKTFLQFLTIYSDIIVNREKDLGFGFLCYFESPVHRVARGSVKVDGSFPLRFVLIDTHFLHRSLVVPYYVDLCDYRAVHCGIAVKILHELGVVATTCVGDRDQTETYYQNAYVVGTSSSWTDTAKKEK